MGSMAWHVTEQIWIIIKVWLHLQLVEPGTRAQGHKGTRAQGHKGTRAQGHKGTRAQGHKGTRAQGHKGTRAAVQEILKFKEIWKFQNVQWINKQIKKYGNLKFPLYIYFAIFCHISPLYFAIDSRFKIQHIFLVIIICIHGYTHIYIQKHTIALQQWDVQQYEHCRAIPKSHSYCN